MHLDRVFAHAQTACDLFIGEVTRYQRSDVFLSIGQSPTRQLPRQIVGMSPKGTRKEKALIMNSPNRFQEFSKGCIPR
jgi:hypothetical protein